MRSAPQPFLAALRSGTLLVMWTEGWGVLDSVYWSVVTSASVGYGDLTNTSEGARFLSTIYMLLSVGGFAASLSRYNAAHWLKSSIRHIR